MEFYKQSLFFNFLQIFWKFRLSIMKRMTHFSYIYIYFFKIYDRKSLVANFHFCGQGPIFYQPYSLSLSIKNGKNAENVCIKVWYNLFIFFEIFSNVLQSRYFRLFAFGSGSSQRALAGEQNFGPLRVKINIFCDFYFIMVVVTHRGRGTWLSGARRRIFGQ